MKGYNQHSLNQRSVLLLRAPLVEESLKFALAITEESLRVADYGSSEGLNSMLLFKNVLESFRTYSNREVFITHTDVPENDWSALYNLINTSEDSYLSLPGVYYSTIGKSFYSQLFPSQSIHVGFSSSAFHWLSKSIHLQNKEELTLQAKQDARTILSHRIEELAIGGTLLFSVGEKDPDGSVKFLFKVYNQALLSLLQKGILSQEQIQNLKINLHFMSKSEWEEVLSEFQDKIEIIKIESEKTPNFHNAQYLKDQNLEKYKSDFSSSISSIIKDYLIKNFNKSKEEGEILFNLLVEELKAAIESNKEEEVFNYRVNVTIRRLN